MTATENSAGNRPAPDAREFRLRRRSKNRALLIILLVLAALFYATTLARLSESRRQKAADALQRSLLWASMASNDIFPWPTSSLPGTGRV